jgi:hypothetical protein
MGRFRNGSFWRKNAKNLPFNTKESLMAMSAKKAKLRNITRSPPNSLLPTLIALLGEI